MIFDSVNWVSVLVVTIGAYIIGSLWYSPLLFAKKWMKLQGFTKKDIQGGNMAAMMITGFILTFVMVLFLDVLILGTGNTDFMTGLGFGFLTWLGFLATVMYNAVLYEKKPRSLYLLNTCHYLVVFSLAGGVLAIW